MKDETTVKEALETVYRELNRLQELGFLTVAMVTITKGSKAIGGDAQLFINPDGRFGVLKVRPGEAEPKMNPVKVAQALQVTQPGDGLVTDSGSVCVSCSGTSFRRIGSCLYCTNCGESLSGCS